MRRIKNCFMPILVVAFVCIYVAIILVFSSETAEKNAAYKLLVEENNALTDLNTAYNRELDYVTSPDGIKLYAHMYGWQYPDEICFNAVAIGHD